MQSIEKNNEYKEEKRRLKEEKHKSWLYKKSKTKKAKLKKAHLPTWEKELFLEIRNERKHICIICWQYIHEAKTFCFAHLLPKGTYPKYRLNKSNIAIVCSIDCHHKLDSLVSWNKKVVQDCIDNNKRICFAL